MFWTFESHCQIHSTRISLIIHCHSFARCLSYLVTFRSYYSAKGSLYTFCRIPIAGTDFSTRAYTYDDTPGDVTLSNFNLVEEDDYKIGYLHQIMNVMPNSHNLKIFTAAWSAPPWMKDTDNIQWGNYSTITYKTLFIGKKEEAKRKVK